MNLDNKKIGIWGFGIVGKAALKYFASQDITTIIMDCKKLLPEELEIIKKSKSSYAQQETPTVFLNNNDLILASPGIDLRPYAHYQQKFITELDLFAYHCKVPIIAITGTLGKTSITHLLSKIIENTLPVITGGNIGIGMLELLTTHNEASIATLEVSSFQLENCKTFAPDLAIWTNFYPNHLDRHTTLDEYFNAKYTIIKHQQAGQNALIPFEIASQIAHKKSHADHGKGNIHFFSLHKPCLHQLEKLPPGSNGYWQENKNIIRFHNNQQTEIMQLEALPNNTFAINWIIIIAALDILKIPYTIPHIAPALPEHRIEKIATHATVTFYNDSKATVMESTIAAINKLQEKQIILFLGGLSKGIDRTTAIAQLKSKVKYIICFGKEAHALNQIAQNYTIPSKSFATLEDGFAYALTLTQPHDQLLLSPGGSSYDLFNNYEERGKRFKELVFDYIKKS